MRKVAVITVGRSDYGIFRPVLQRIKDDPAMELVLIAGGAHIGGGGRGIDAIRSDGFVVSAEVDCYVRGDTRADICDAIGRGVTGFGKVLEDLKPDIMLVLGDRFETFSAVVAAVPLLVPVAHIHGGEITEGAIDESFRHAITKMSHLHFAATQEYGRRIRQMGEEPWRVTVSGAPGLDNLQSLKLLDRKVVGTRLGMDLQEDPLLVTYHPVTLEHPSAREQVMELLAALDDVGRPVVMTFPNVDPEHGVIIKLFKEYVAKHADSVLAEDLGTDMYFSLMKISAAMVGNSSSGIIEAASFGLPVVNIGNRQKGRLRNRNVVDSPCRRDTIIEAIRTVIKSEFRAGLTDVINLYGNGRAAERIVSVLRDVPLGSVLLTKKFIDRQ